MSQLTTLDPKARTPRPLLIVLVIALLVGAWFVLLRPIEGRAKDAIARRDQAAAELQANQQRLTNLNSGKPDELGPLIEIWRGSGELLPSASNARDVAIAMIDQISAAGRTAGLTVNVKPTSDGAVAFPADPRLQAVEFSLTADGDLGSFSTFLTQLESLKPLVVVSALDIGAGRQGATLSMTIYVLTTTAELSGNAPVIPANPQTPAQTTLPTVPDTTLPDPNGSPLRPEITIPAADQPGSGA